MSNNLKEGVKYYIYAEYNPFWIYMGWWLYAIPISEFADQDFFCNLRSKSESWLQATWLKYDWRLDALMEAIGLPQLHDYRGNNHSESCHNFLKKYPSGLICLVKGDGREFIVESGEVAEYNRIVRERQLLHIAKAQEEDKKDA
jgi:hypothetical protein